jgi:hypothetical protein
VSRAAQPPLAGLTSLADLHQFVRRLIGVHRFLFDRAHFLHGMVLSLKLATPMISDAAWFYEQHWFFTMTLCDTSSDEKRSPVKN